MNALNMGRAGRWCDKALRAGLMLTTALTASAFLATSSHAGSWTGGTGDWFDPANWDSGVPTAGDYATLDNGGTAQIEAPGAFSQGFAAGFNSGTSGTVEVSGSDASWINTYTIYLAYDGTGTLTVSDGASVTTQATLVGYSSAGHGTLNVDGEGSLFDTSSYLWIGNEGEGHVSITNGGAVNSVYSSLGEEAGGTGSVTVDGEGSSWYSRFQITVGNVGEGRLDISNGGSVTTDSNVYLGVYTDSAGTVTVDGEDSTLDATAALNVGIFGEGVLEITNGGAVRSGSGDVGVQSTGSGRVTVDGEGSSWVNADSLRIGSHGNGSLEITNGGLVVVENLGGAIIASNIGGTGSVTVDGEDSIFNAGVRLTVGQFGDGTLTITNGGTVNAGTVQAGTQDSGSGTILVDGIGSSLNMTGGDSSTLGFWGDAVLTVSNGGSVVAGGQLRLAETAASSATINIGAAADENATAVGTFAVDSIYFGDGDGEIVFNHTDTGFELASNLSGSGTLRQIGSGTTIFTGDSSGFWGTNSVEHGAMFVNGLLGGTTTVGAARLGGVGTVSNVALGNGSVIAPGSSAGSIGTLTVSGDLTFHAGSTYEVEINPASVANDLIHVAGTAYLNNASVEHIGLSGTYPWYVSRTILTADTGIDGTFGSINSNMAFLIPDLSYDANNVRMTLLRNDIELTDVAVSPNQQGAAGAANTLGVGNPIYDQIVTMTAEEAQAAFEALSGEAYSSEGTSAFNAAQQLRDVLQARLNMLSSGSSIAGMGYAPAAGEALSADAPAIWGQVFGSWGVNDATATAAKLERRSSGFLGGADKAIGEDSRVGLAFGYSHSDFDVSSLRSSSESDNFHLAGYASTKLGNVDLGGNVSYSYGMADAKRTVVVGGLTNNLAADYDTHTVQASVEAGMDFDMTEVVLTPFAGLAGTYVRTDSFTETGGPAALTIDASDNLTGVSSLGLRVRREAGHVALTGSAAWRHAFGDVDPASRVAFASAPAATFVVRGAPVAEDTLAVGAQIDLDLDEATMLTVGYAGEFASDTRDSALRAELRVEF